MTNTGTVANRHRLCSPCRELFMRWIDAPMARGGIRIHTIADGNPRLIEDVRRARARDHYALIDRQSRGVVKNCKAGRHASPAG